jgi:SH3 domain-containing protein
LRASIRVVASVWFAGAIALAAWFGPSPNPFAPGPALAASCTNKSHKLTLTNGTASPGSGTTTTSFRFSVRYTDNANCPPIQVSVTIPGVGLFPLTASSSAYSSGVTFSVSRRLPVGTWTYLFTAQSGSGGGSRSVTLRSVSPSRVVVAAASATPTPTPTPKPTVKPAPKPTSKPGPRPTPGPTTKPGATPSGGAAATPEESVPPDESQPPTADETGDPSGLGTGDDGSGGGGGGFGLPPVFHGSAEAGFVTWLFTTAGGLLLFAFLMRRQRYQPQPVPSDVAAGVGGSGDVDPAGEARMPRWRRPSVQAARSASRYGETITRPPLKFPGPPATGVERAVVQYRFVRVADSPDNIRSMELGRLDRGDEVDVLERRSGFAHVQAPDGLDGWVPRMTLAQIESPD